MEKQLNIKKPAGSMEPAGALLRKLLRLAAGPS